jgi:hypothetical protein
MAYYGTGHGVADAQLLRAVFKYQDMAFFIFRLLCTLHLRPVYLPVTPASMASALSSDA